MEKEQSKRERETIAIEMWNMKVLITGVNGQVGWELDRRGAQHGFKVLGLDHADLDITNSNSVDEAIQRAGISLVVNAAAYTNVDRAESEPELAFAVNRDGPAHLASSCAEAEIPLIHISTDYVFDGTRKGPYFETDPISPLGVYGRSKAAGEAEVEKRVKEHIILRTAWVYGVHGNNFVKTMIRLGNEREILRVVDDQYGCPTYAADIADAIFAIASYILKGRQIAWGTYHYCGKGATSWHSFAEKIVELTREYGPLAVKGVKPISTEEYPTPVKRPANSVLDCSLIGKHFAIQPKAWGESLKDMIHRLLSFKE